MTIHFTTDEIESHAVCRRHNFPLEKNRIPVLSPFAAGEREWRMGAEFLLESARLQLGGHPIIVNCGYRCPELNKMVGGVPSSQHQGFYSLKTQLVKAVAFDLDYPPEFGGNQALFDCLQQMDFDQLIFEQKGGSEWIHVGWLPYSTNRRQVMDQRT